MYQSSFCAPSTPLFARANLLKLPDIYKLEVGKYMHKVHTDKILNMHTLLKKSHDYQTRKS